MCRQAGVKIAELGGNTCGYPVESSWITLFSGLSQSGAFILNPSEVSQNCDIILTHARGCEWGSYLSF